MSPRLVFKRTFGGPGAVSPTTGHEWLALLDRQVAIQRQWARLFEAFDVVLAPAFGTAAFPHTEFGDPATMALTVNGGPTPYFDQLAWAGPATLGGLPIGAQIIGPYLEDRTTIGFAGLLERELGGFRAPPAA